MNPPTSPKADSGFARRAERDCLYRGNFDKVNKLTKHLTMYVQNNIINYVKGTKKFDTPERSI